MKTFEEFRSEVRAILEEDEETSNRTEEPDLDKAASVAVDAEGEHEFDKEHDFYHALGYHGSFGVHSADFQKAKDLWQKVVNLDNKTKAKVLEIIKQH